MKLGSIHHVAIIVSDYERSKKFYVEKLGFEIIRENYRAERGDYKLDLKLGRLRTRNILRRRQSAKALLSRSVRASPSRFPRRERGGNGRLAEKARYRM